MNTICRFVVVLTLLAAQTLKLWPEKNKKSGKVRLIENFHMQISVVNRTDTRLHATRRKTAQSRKMFDLAYRVHPLDEIIKSHVTFSYQLVTSEYT